MDAIIYFRSFCSSVPWSGCRQPEIFYLRGAKTACCSVCNSVIAFPSGGHRLLCAPLSLSYEGLISETHVVIRSNALNLPNYTRRKHSSPPSSDFFPLQGTAQTTSGWAGLRWRPVRSIHWLGGNSNLPALVHPFLRTRGHFFDLI